MAHLLVGSCTVAMTQMQQFTTRIQNWEQDVVGTPDGPDFHGVYLRSGDPGRVLIELRFRDRAAAEACIAAGHVERLEREVVACTGDESEAFVGYDLFYGASRNGERTVFGDTVHHIDG
jgi:hypothetical protein